jgi:hypothetical protein
MDHAIYLVAEPDPDSLFGWLLFLDEGGGMTRRILPHEQTFTVCGTVFDRDGYESQSFLPDPVEQSVRKLLVDVAKNIRWTGKP